MSVSEYRVRVPDPKDRDLCETIARLQEDLSAAHRDVTYLRVQLTATRDSLDVATKRLAESASRIHFLEAELDGDREEEAPSLSVQQEIGHEEGRVL